MTFSYKTGWLRLGGGALLLGSAMVGETPDSRLELVWLGVVLFLAYGAFKSALFSNVQLMSEGLVVQGAFGTTAVGYDELESLKPTPYFNSITLEFRNSRGQPRQVWVNPKDREGFLNRLLAKKPALRVQEADKLGVQVKARTTNGSAG